MDRVFLSRPVIGFVLFAERWLLSCLFFFLAYECVATLQLLELMRHSQDVLLPAPLLARDAGFRDGVHFEDYARYGLLTAANLVCGVFLLISRRPTRTPTRAAEVAIPLAGTFGYMVFNQFVVFPAWMTGPLVPAAWTTALAGLGVFYSLLGATLSIGSMLWLGRSMGIVISVRKVVIGGPYHFVRHPMYLGHVLVLAGLLLTACNVRMCILVAGTVAILVWRARLEEEVLCASSAAYRAWWQVTGFLWPRRPGLRAPLPVPAAGPAARRVRLAKRLIEPAHTLC